MRYRPALVTLLVMALAACGDSATPEADAGADAGPPLTSDADAESAADVPQGLDADVAADPGPDADAVADLGPSADADADDGTDDADAEPAPTLIVVMVQVLIDGEPAADTRVVQGGNFEDVWLTGPEGMVSVAVDLTVPGDHYVMASHPEARNRGAHVEAGELGPVIIELTRFDDSDNEDYVFKDPGEPDKSHVIEKCAHCHDTVDRSWFDSTHRTSASNPQLQDLYPEVKALGTTGACADCHAPAIDGVLGGRDLDDAEGYALDYGVHCEVCHHIESVHMDLEAGVAGRLRIVRPSELAPFEGVGTYLPLMFCTNHDIANFYMGCVQRDHFTQGEMCGGCHQLDQPALTPELTPDPTRWPDGRLPIHSSYAEWLEHGPGAALPCQGCHMQPADPSVLNSADLQLWGLGSTGVTGGWPRPPGHTLRHTFSGPRSPEADQIGPPATLAVSKTADEDSMTVSVTVKPEGAGHAVPTGEPMRSLVVVVEARCGETPLAATGGDVVPSFGGFVARKEAGEDWASWSGAQVGQVVRVVKRPGGFRDYDGFGPFSDGTFDAEAKGLPVEAFAGEATITAVDGDAVTFDDALPPGDVAYLGEAPTDIAQRATAGHPGWAFARVLTNAAGEEMVAHYEAVDVRVDNRLLPGTDWTSQHTFDATECSDPEVTATLLYRALPARLARARGWPLRDRVLDVVTK